MKNKNIPFFCSINSLRHLRFVNLLCSTYFVQQTPNVLSSHCLRLEFLAWGHPWLSDQDGFVRGESVWSAPP